MLLEEYSMRMGIQILLNDLPSEQSKAIFFFLLSNGRISCTQQNKQRHTLKRICMKGVFLAKMTNTGLAIPESYLPKKRENIDRLDDRALELANIHAFRQIL